MAKTGLEQECLTAGKNRIVPLRPENILRLRTGPFTVMIVPVGITK